MVALAAWAGARAAIVDLDAYVEYAILGANGAPLADGSWVYIIGSGDSYANPMASIGTNYLAGTVTGDDVILAVVQINLDAFSNGTFFATVQYDSAVVSHAYIRFFDTTGPLTGLLAWGTSPVYQLGVTLGVSTLQFDYGGILQTTQTNNFVVIPEPGTGNLIVLVAGMIWAMRASMKKKRTPEEARPGDGSKG